MRFVYVCNKVSGILCKIFLKKCTGDLQSPKLKWKFYLA
jgi:hypothetical protein